MRAFEKVDFPAPAGPVTKTAYLILGRVKVPGAKQCVLIFQVERMVVGER